MLVMSLSACGLLTSGTDNPLDSLLGGDEDNAPVYEGMSILTGQASVRAPGDGSTPAVISLSTAEKGKTRLIPLSEITEETAALTEAVTDEAATAPVETDASSSVPPEGGWEIETVEPVSEEIEEVVTIEVNGDEVTKYFVKPGEVFTVEIHLSNPEAFEIQSFTLNGEKYANYMFKENSTLELLRLDVTAPETPGYFELTIDAIKYIDGTEIKDVRMDGDRTVKAGVTYLEVPTATYSEIQVGTTTLSLVTEITDPQGVLADVPVVFYLSDGETVVAEQPLQVGANTVTVEGLYMGRAYEYGVVAAYDPVDGEGARIHWLSTDTFETPEGLVLTDHAVGQEDLSFTMQMNDPTVVLDSITLVDEATGEPVEPLEYLSTSTLGGLLSSHTYRLILAFSYPHGEETVTDTCTATFTTLSKTPPTLSVEQLTASQTDVFFDLLIEDVDGILTIEKIELLLAGETVAVAEDAAARTFAGLLTDNDYTVRVTYTYDLNDGTDPVTLTAEGTVRTLAKAVPTVALQDPASTRTDMTFAVATTDPDAIMTIVSVELLEGETVLATVPFGDTLAFDGLLPGTQYTARITYTYDLGDGTGVHTEIADRSYPTMVDSIKIEEFLVLDNQAVRKGEEVSLRLFFNNSSEIELLGVYVNGQRSEVISGNRLTTAVVKFAPVETGFVEFKVDRVEYRLHGEILTQAVDAEALLSYPVYDDLTVSFTPVTANPYEYTGNGIYLTIENLGDYEICSINGNTDFTAFSNYEFLIPDTAVHSIEYRYLDYTMTSQIFLYDATTDKTWNYQGIKQYDDYHEIRTVEELLAMTSGYYILMNDLDLRHLKADYTIELTGVLQGNGHTILGLGNIVDVADAGYRPVISGGSIYDVKFEELYVKVTRSAANRSDRYVSVNPFGGAKLVNCDVSGEIIVVCEGDTVSVSCDGNNYKASSSFDLTVTVNGETTTQTVAAEARLPSNPNVLMQDGFIFYICPNGYAVLCDATMDREAATIAIPATVNGHPVKGIASRAFAGYDKLLALYIPSSVATLYADIAGGNGSITFYTDAEAVPADWGTTWNPQDRPVILNSHGACVGEYGLVYALFTDGTAAVKHILATQPVYNENGELIGYENHPNPVIPETVEGYRVTAICANAFEDCTAIRSITIPATVTVVEENAFAASEKGTIFFCRAASHPTLWVTGWMPTNCTVYWNYKDHHLDGQGLFYIIRNTDTADVVGFVPTYIGAEDGTVLGIAVPDIVIPTTVKDYPVTGIMADAFPDCTYIKSITIPASVTTVKRGSFPTYAYELTVYCQAAARPDTWYPTWNPTGCSVFWDYKDHYTDEQGITYIIRNDDTADVVAFELIYTLDEEGKETSEPMYPHLIIPETVNGYTVTTICTNAFQVTNHIEGIVIPESVTVIELSAFGRFVNSLTFYCEAAEQPAGWNAKWNPYGRPVVWGYSLTADATDPAA